MANVLGDALPAPPTDGITQLKFSQFTNTLLASSWDKVLYAWSNAWGARMACLHEQLSDPY
eukprot:1157703-Pelagomonas_calceolata.AAC.7